MEISFRGNDLLTGPDDPFRHQRGQALLEYILILVVTVALILGLMFEFNTAFQAWANNYFGDYLTCLLETGELPTIDGSPGDSQICGQFFEPFSLKNGRPSKALSKGSGSDNQNPNANARRGSARPEGTSARRSSGSGSSKWADSGSGKSGSAVNSQDAKGAEAGGKTGNMSTSTSGGYYSSRPSKQGADNGRQLDGRVGGGFKKDPEQKKGYLSGTARGEGSSGSPAKLRLKPTRKPATEAAEGTPLTFGNFIRILIIAAIIIALVMVVGGQLLQISKGMDD